MYCGLNTEKSASQTLYLGGNNRESSKDWYSIRIIFQLKWSISSHKIEIVVSLKVVNHLSLDLERSNGLTYAVNQCT